MVFREQQKLDSSYLSYLIYHEATFIVNTAGGKGGGGGKGEGRENTEIHERTQRLFTGSTIPRRDVFSADS